jgi:hypothetical protein
MVGLERVGFTCEPVQGVNRVVCMYCAPNTISVAPVLPPAAEVHALPCKINYSGPADVSMFFLPEERSGVSLTGIPCQPAATGHLPAACRWEVQRCIQRKVVGRLCHEVAGACCRYVVLSATSR